jgi:hypothetical protein
MLTSAGFALLLLACIGLARRNMQLRGELADARWTIAEKLEKELLNRPPKVYVMPRRDETKRGGDAA